MSRGWEVSREIIEKKEERFLIAAAARYQSTAASATAGPSTAPPLRASLLLSRQPLLTRTLTPLESTYYDHTLKLRHALSNPINQEFYFRPGSLPHRRYQHSEWQYEKAVYGPVLAGKEPEVGDIPPERPVEEISRDHWEKLDSERGEKSLERFPEEEVFCLVSDGAKWEFPSVEVKEGEALHEAVERITGTEGLMDGNTMDTWLVTRKPIGFTKEGDNRTFFLRSHILAGEPRPTADFPWKSWAWLTRREIKDKLGKEWDSVSNMFGSPTSVQKAMREQTQATTQIEIPEV